MTTEQFEIFVLKPRLKTFGFDYDRKLKIQLCDGSTFKLSEKQNKEFQDFMITEANKHLSTQPLN